MDLPFLKTFVKNFSTNISEDLHFSLNSSQVKNIPILSVGSGLFSSGIFLRILRVMLCAWCSLKLIPPMNVPLGRALPRCSWALEN